LTYGGINDLAMLQKNLAENCIPDQISTMEAKDYGKFLEMRRMIIAKKLKGYYNSL
jgi:hypothetical protein